jgi:hypothetical protein
VVETTSEQGPDESFEERTKRRERLPQGSPPKLRGVRNCSEIGDELPITRNINRESIASIKRANTILASTERRTAGRTILCLLLRGSPT